MKNYTCVNSCISPNTYYVDTIKLIYVHLFSISKTLGILVVRGVWFDDCSLIVVCVCVCRHTEAIIQQPYSQIHCLHEAL